MSHINISLTANTASYVQRLKDAKTQTDRNVILMEKRIDQFARDVNANFTTVEGSINAMLNSLANVKGGGYVAALAGLGIAIGTVGAQVHSMAKQAAEAQLQLEKAAAKANMNVSEFQTMARVFGTVGLEMEKIGDISKDVQDRIGDFATSGGGALKDFYETMTSLGTKTDLSIDKLQKMSSPEALGAVVSELERAGASGSQMIFVMESLASDSSDLIPLLKDNAAGLKEMQKRMEEIGDTQVIDPDVVVEMKVLEQNWETLWNNVGAIAGNSMGSIYEGLNKMLVKINQVANAMVLDGKAKDLSATVGNSITWDGSQYQAGANANVVDEALSYEDSVVKEDVLRKVIEMREKAIKESENSPFAPTTSHHKAVIAHLKEQLSIQEKITAKKKEDLELKKNEAPTGDYTKVEAANAAKAKAKAEAANVEKEIEAARFRELQMDIRFAEDKRTQMLAQQALEVEDLKRSYGEKFALNEDYLKRSAQLELQHAEAQRVFNDAEEVSKLEKKMAAYATQEEIDLAVAEHKLQQYQDYLAQFNEVTAAQAEEEVGLQQEVTNAKRALKQSEMDMLQGFVGELSAGLKEGSTAQKVAFAAEKALVMASMAMKMEDNALKAKSAAMAKNPLGGVAAGESAALLSRITDGAKIAAVAATAIGQFHSGTDEVDQTGSYILKKGERVVQETANKDLTSFLDGNKGKGEIKVDAPLIIEGDTSISESKLLSMLANQREQIAQMVNLAQRENPSIR